MYCDANRGRYPDRLEDLLLTQPIDSWAFICPSTHDTPAPGATPAQQAANLSTGGHLSYIYLAKGWNDYRLSPDAVIAYEPPNRHHGRGNVLFGDGHVKSIPISDNFWMTAPWPGAPPSTQPVGSATMR
jgi:prepilin-type processing-associated H-X9-DG protein